MPLTSAAVIQIWRDVLGLNYVGEDPNFFEWGGNSLSASRLAIALTEHSGMHVTVRTIFQNPSPAALVQAINDPAYSEGTVRWRTPGDADSIAAADPADPGEEDRPAPLSAQQKAIWFQERLNQQLHSYNCVIAVRLPGRIDAERLRNALRMTISRHEILRTSFPYEKGIPVQVVHDPGEAIISLSIRDSLEADALSAELLSLGQTAFDVTTLPLIQWILFQGAGSHEAVLVQVEHHFVHDGWSSWLVLDEIAAFYRESFPVTSPQAPYTQFATRQERWLATTQADEQRRYLVETVRAGAEQTVSFPRDSERPSVFSGEGITVLEPVPSAAASTLISSAASIGVTPFTLLYTSFAILMSEVCGAGNFVVGTAFRNRRPEFSSTVGMFVNVVPIAVQIGDDSTFADLAHQVSSSLAAADDCQEIPLSTIVRDLNLARQLSRNPVLQVCFSMNDWPHQELDFGEWVTDDIEYPPTGAKFDLDVVALPPQGGKDWRLLWRAYAAVLSEAEVRRLIRRFDEILGLGIRRSDCTVAAIRSGSAG